MVLAAFRLLERTDGPVILEDFAEGSAGLASSRERAKLESEPQARH
jgi:hypothetical protein